MNLMAGKVLNPGQRVRGCHLPEPGPVLCLVLAPGRDTQQISPQFLNEHTTTPGSRIISDQQHVARLRSGLDKTGAVIRYLDYKDTPL